ncbi:hypothetical protein FACS1894102_1520 [Spirochaetia bacterium]|nr:hypothetical protein FACS1894102_1520 [Spirochaetia bacterium]
MKKKFNTIIYLFLSVFSCVLFALCSSGTSAEEYYSIGMAYYEMGKYDEAQRWLSRAVGKNKTLRASEYNLGRIAFETGRYTDASKYFSRILKKDPKNVMALQAEAYTQIKLGNLEEAEKYYKSVLELQPENADSGYNHALILFAMDKPAEAEETLLKYEYQLEENKENLLLFARVQKAQKKVEAIDSFDKWLQKYDDPVVRYEYACVLEEGNFYAKALEEIKTAVKNFTSDTAALSKVTVRFELAKIMLIADPKNDDGITELTEVLKEGFKDEDAINALIKNEQLPKTRQDEIKRLYDAHIKEETDKSTESSKNAATSTNSTSSSS